MSFSSDVKQELCKLPLDDNSIMRAECYGMLLFAARFDSREIIFKSENNAAATRLEYLLTALFSPVILEKRSALRSERGSGLYRLSVPDSDDCKRIFETFGHSERDIRLRINRANIPDENYYSAFLRGVFLSCGSVTDPAKGYHLELSVRHKTLAENLAHMIGEVEVFAVNPKLVTRKGGYIVYIKSVDRLCDFLGFIGAGGSVLKVMQAAVLKEKHTQVVRQGNFELANIKKLSDAAARQTNAIKKIQSSVGLEALPSDLIELAKVRLENPDMSLRELGESLTPPISRSGVNHRLDRIMKFAERI